jgi:hypothetical protein
MKRSDALYLASGGLALAAAPSLAHAEPVATIRIGGGSNDNMGESYFARDGGFIKRHDLDARSPNSAAARRSRQRLLRVC